MFPMTIRDLSVLVREFDRRRRRLSNRRRETRFDLGAPLSGISRIEEPASNDPEIGYVIDIRTYLHERGSDSGRENRAGKASISRRFMLCAIAMLALWPSNARASAITLEYLLNGGQILSGDKLFYGFQNYRQSGDLTIDPATIDVFAIESIVPGGSEYGIRFQRSAGWELAGPNKLYDMSFDFLVKVTLPDMHISDNTLEFTGNRVGGGEAHLVEGVTDFAFNDTLANKEVYINIANSGIDKLVDHKLFSHTSNLIKISKDFQLQTRSGVNDNIFVSHFDQTFSQVQAPEPGSVILTVIGGLILAGHRIRKSRRQSSVDVRIPSSPAV